MEFYDIIIQCSLFIITRKCFWGGVLLKKIAIIGAWQPELDLLNKRYPIVKTQKLASWNFHFHLAKNIEIISVITRVGKVKAASCTQLLICNFNPDELYMTGICGGLSEDVNPCDLIIPIESIQHDVTDSRLISDPCNLIYGRSSSVKTSPTLIKAFRDFLNYEPTNVHFGTIVSGDQRIRECKSKLLLNEKYNAIGVDQEVASFSHVCYLNSKPFFSIKSISDKSDENTIEIQKKFKLKACNSSCNLLLDFLEEYNK